MARHRAPRRAPRQARRRRLGQSLAEFALTVPLALLMVLFGLDFGRVFLGWVALNQAAREAANYAAMNPTAWTLPYNLAVQAEYARLVTTEASNINCTLADARLRARPSPTGPSIGAPALVELDCRFSLITPIIGVLTGNPIPVSASSAFPIRSGNIEGVPAASDAADRDRRGLANADARRRRRRPPPTPTPTPARGAHADTRRRRQRRRRRPRPTPAMCTVISLLNVQSNKAQADWHGAGFTRHGHLRAARPAELPDPVAEPDRRRRPAVHERHHRAEPRPVTARLARAPRAARSEPRRVRPRHPDHRPARSSVFVEIGRAVFAYNTIANAARQGGARRRRQPAARRDRLRRVAPDRGSVRAALVDPRLRHRCAGKTLGSAPANVTVAYVTPPSTTLTCTPTLHVGCIATVTVTYHYALTTPFVSRFIGPFTMTQTSEMPVERVFP